MKSEFFSRAFIERIPEDNDEAIQFLASEYHKMFARISTSGDFNNDFIEVYALLEAFIAARELPVKLPPITPPEIDRHAVFSALQEAKGQADIRVFQRDSKSHFSSKHDEYRALFSKARVYEFSESDYTRVQELVSEIREEIQKSALIPEEHKRRLFRRLEAMQAELHKKTSDIDRFWGFVAEAGIVARKFGEDLKPLNERVLELGKIVTYVIMSREGIHALPEIEKLLHLK